MKLRVLGCDGGRGQGYYSTGLLLDDTVLIDAGTILSALTVEEALKITDIFLTHSHLDHICELPYLLDATFDMRREPLRIHAQKETIDVLMKHIFNWVVWPDFSKLPTPERGQFTIHEIKPGKAYQAGGLNLTPIEVNHTIPTVGYKIADKQASIVFTGDTGPTKRIWDVANESADLKAVIVDLSFAIKEQYVANVSKHMTADDLANELKKLNVDCDVYAFHYKVGQATTVGAQAQRVMHFGRPVMHLREHETLYF
ncbi:MAG: MBL fold metallo-hydrolase [Proteobacteria bacterium]|nr:MBL fold metallo-hydrolase [Pseudomonadota bacterium]